MLRAIVLIQFVWSCMISIAFCSNKFSSNGQSRSTVNMLESYISLALPSAAFYNGSNNILIELRLFCFLALDVMQSPNFVCIPFFWLVIFNVRYLYILKIGGGRLIIDNFCWHTIRPHNVKVHGWNKNAS